MPSSELAHLTVNPIHVSTGTLHPCTHFAGPSTEAAVDQLLTELGLWEARDVVVGSTMVKGISGGQAKRTNIAIALITNPAVLFLAGRALLTRGVCEPNMRGVYGMRATHA